MAIIGVRELRIPPPEWKKSRRTYLEDETLRVYLIQMHNSLEERKLEVGLVPARVQTHENHKERDVTNTNPLWYQNLCANYLTNRNGYRTSIYKRTKRRDKSRRKEKFPDTKIKRRDTLNNLRNFVKNGYSHSPYAEDYVEIAEKLKKQEGRVEKIGILGGDLSDMFRECPEIIDLHRISRKFEE